MSWSNQPKACVSRPLSNNRLRRRSVFLALCVLPVLTLADCVSPVVWEKPGATQTGVDADKVQCTTTAGEQVPALLVTTTTPSSVIYPTPGQPSCYEIDGALDCNVWGNIIEEPVTTTYDANTEMRSHAFDSCMYSKGYLQGAGL